MSTQHDAPQANEPFQKQEDDCLKVVIAPTMVGEPS